MREYHPNLKTSMIARATPELPFRLEGLVTPLPDGKLFACWTEGGIAEPRRGNYTCASISEDKGASWKEPFVLFRHPQKGLFTTVVYCFGGVIRAYLNTYQDNTGFAEDMQSYYSESYDGGRTFTPPRSIPGCINNVHIKQSVKVGEDWILPFSWREITGNQWAFPTVGAPEKSCMVGGKESEHTALGVSMGEAAEIEAYYQWASQNTEEYVGVLITNPSGNRYRLRGRIQDPSISLCEPSLVELSDGTLVMYIRSNKERRLYESRSYNHGETWTPAVPLEIPTPITKVRLYRDHAGTIYFLHNPSYERRSPLSLWISRDDLRTWSEKYDLVTDTDLPLAYPDGYIDEENGLLCFAWDDRRNIYFSQWPISR